MGEGMNSSSEEPGVLASVRCGGPFTGGSLGYPRERLFREVAYIAYYFHWPRGEIMTMDHLERQHWVEEIARINQRLNRGPAEEDSE